MAAAAAGELFQGFAHRHHRRPFDLENIRPHGIEAARQVQPQASRLGRECRREQQRRQYRYE